MDTIISVDDIEELPRGKRKDINPELCRLLKEVNRKKALRLGSSFPPAFSRVDRNRVSTSIRKHWEEVRTDRPRIDFNEQGIAQVRVREE